jgi:hypothetical protein
MINRIVVYSAFISFSAGSMLIAFYVPREYLFLSLMSWQLLYGALIVIDLLRWYLRKSD